MLHLIIARFDSPKNNIVAGLSILHKVNGKWVLLSNNPHFRDMIGLESHFARNINEMQGVYNEIMWAVQSDPEPLKCGACGQKTGWVRPSIGTHKCTNCGKLKVEWE